MLGYLQSIGRGRCIVDLAGGWLLASAGTYHLRGIYRGRSRQLAGSNVCPSPHHPRVIHTKWSLDLFHGAEGCIHLMSEVGNAIDVLEVDGCCHIPLLPGGGSVPAKK